MVGGTDRVVFFGCLGRRPPHFCRRCQPPVSSRRVAQGQRPTQHADRLRVGRCSCCAARWARVRGRPHPRPDDLGIRCVALWAHRSSDQRSPRPPNRRFTGNEETEAELALTVEQHGRCQPFSRANQEGSFERGQRRGEEKEPKRVDEIGRNTAEEMKSRINIASDGFLPMRDGTAWATS